MKSYSDDSTNSCNGELKREFSVRGVKDGRGPGEAGVRGKERLSEVLTANTKKKRAEVALNCGKRALFESLEGDHLMPIAPAPALAVC